MGNSNFGNINSKFANGTPTTKIVDTTTLTYNYVDGNWIFSLTNISPEVQRLIDSGYNIQIQAIRDLGRNTYSMYGKDRSKESPIKTQLRKSNGLKYVISTIIKTTPQNMQLNDFMFAVLEGDQLGVLHSLAFSKPEQWESFCNRHGGKWFRKYQFCIEINNVYYATSSILYIWTHDVGTVDFTTAYLEYEDNNLNVYPV